MGAKRVNPFSGLVWCSVCSAHREYVTGCAACQKGYWAERATSIAKCEHYVNGERVPCPPMCPRQDWPARPNPTIVTRDDASWLAFAVVCVVLAALIGLLAAGVI